MPGAEELDLLDRADRGEKGRSFGSGAFEGSESAFADIVEIAALEMAALAIVGAPQDHDQLPAMPFRVKDGVRFDMHDLSGG